MTPAGSAGDEAAVAELRYLRSPRAIRERCEALYALALRGELRHWTVDESRLDAIARRVVRTTQAAYPDLRAIPGHSRWTHFLAGGIDRVRALDERLASVGDDEHDDERLASRFDLV
ncbi:MAG TPA: DUF1688 family protein, partial [Polyangiaceae bacterium]|nr:DUF1688 family protein [Polyangiaceae bacterium]